MYIERMNVSCVFSENLTLSRLMVTKVPTYLANLQLLAVGLFRCICPFVSIARERARANYTTFMCSSKSGEGE